MGSGDVAVIVGMARPVVIVTVFVYFVVAKVMGISTGQPPAWME